MEDFATKKNRNVREVSDSLKDKYKAGFKSRYGYKER
jgi:hypothetical protein